MMPARSFPSFLLPLPPKPIRLDDKALENIRYFRKQFRFWLVVNGLDKMPESRKYKELQTIIGEEAVALINTLIMKPHSVALNCETVLQALEENFIPKHKNVVQERYLFRCIAQGENEPIDSFFNRIEKQAYRCEFTESVLDFIHDQFLVGLRDQGLADTICTNLKYLSFPEKLSYCREYQRVAAEMQKEVGDYEQQSQVPTVPVNMRVSAPNLSTMIDGPLTSANSEVTLHFRARNESPYNPSCETTFENANIKEERLDINYLDDQSPILRNMPQAIPFMPLPMKEEKFMSVGNSF